MFCSQNDILGRCDPLHSLAMKSLLRCKASLRFAWADDWSPLCNKTHISKFLPSTASEMLVRIFHWALWWTPTREQTKSFATGFDLETFHCSWASHMFSCMQRPNLTPLAHILRLQVFTSGYKQVRMRTPAAAAQKLTAKPQKKGKMWLPKCKIWVLNSQRRGNFLCCFLNGIWLFLLGTLMQLFSLIFKRTILATCFGGISFSILCHSEEKYLISEQLLIN